MEGRLVFKRCVIPGAGGELVRDAAVVVEGRCITRIAPDAEVPVLPGDWAVEARGRLLLPGQVEGRGGLSGESSEADLSLRLAQGHRQGVTCVLQHVRDDGEARRVAKAAERVGARVVLVGGQAAEASASTVGWLAPGSAPVPPLAPWTVGAEFPRERLGSHVLDTGGLVSPQWARALAAWGAAEVAGPDVAWGDASGSALVSGVFGVPWGAVRVGSLADLVLMDLLPRGPAWSRELARALVSWTVVDGRVVVREGQLVGVDWLELAHEAATGAAAT